VAIGGGVAMFLSLASVLSLGMAFGPVCRSPSAMRARQVRCAIEPPPNQENKEESNVPSLKDRILPANLVEGSEASADFVTQVPTGIVTRGENKNAVLPAWAEEGPVFRRAEFWDNRSATLAEVVNVLGRFESTSEWSERSFFIEVDPKFAKKEVEDNSWTRKRFEMAQRFGMVERVAMQQNLADLPFTNEKLAASLGKSVEEFNELPVSRAAIDVVYDALVESKSSLLQPDVLMTRKNGWINEDGSLNEIAFRLGLYKARGLVIFSWFLLGKGNFVWILVGVQFLHDARPDLFPTPKDLDLFKIFAVI